jgi:predicted transcriptional regulator
LVKNNTIPQGELPRLEQTVRETIRICKDRNVLREYLESREKEVVTIMMSLFYEEI